MKKLISVLAAFILLLSFTACEKRPQAENTNNEKFDIEYWKSEVKNSQTYATIGVGSFASAGENIISGDEILKLAESIQYWQQVEFSPFPAQEDMMHYMYLNNERGDRALQIEFYDDFGIASVSDGTPGDSGKVYWKLGSADNCRQFFTDKNMYFSVEERIKVSDFVYDCFSHKSTTEINDEFNGIFVRLGGTVEKMRVNSISRIPVYDGSHYYVANVGISYKYPDNTRKSYIFIARVENSPAVYEDFRIANLEVQETEKLPAAEYTIADIDYTLWMEKLDAPHYNGFLYGLGSGGDGWTCSSDGLWTYNVMKCITELSLGEEVEMPTHNKNNFVFVLLECENSNYNTRPLLFKFIDDCNYVVVCDCDKEFLKDCNNHTTAFKVNNPQLVIDTFSETGQYISEADYQRIEKHIRKEILSLTSDKINKISVNEEKLPGNLIAGKQINNLHIKNIHHGSENNREEFEADFRAFYYNKEQDIYKQLEFKVRLYRKGNSFETGNLYVYSF